MELALIILIALFALIMLGKAIGAPDPTKMSEGQIHTRIATELAWIAKYHRQPLATQNSKNLSAMYIEKQEYIKRLNTELEARKFGVSGDLLAAQKKELDPIIKDIATLQNSGLSAADATLTALKIYSGNDSGQVAQRQADAETSTTPRGTSATQLAAQAPASPKTPLDFDKYEDRLKAIRINANAVKNTIDTPHIKRGPLGMVLSFIHAGNDESNLYETMTALTRCGASVRQLGVLIDKLSEDIDEGADSRIVIHEAAIAAGDTTIGDLKLKAPSETDWEQATDRFDFLIWSLLYSDYKPKNSSEPIHRPAIERLADFIEFGIPRVPIGYTTGAFKTSNASTFQLIQILIGLTQGKNRLTSLQPEILQAISDISGF